MSLAELNQTTYHDEWKMSTATTTTMTAVGIMGVLGNSISILVLTRGGQMRNAYTNLLILNQSIVDLATSVLIVAMATIPEPNTYYGSRGRLICLLWSSDLLFWVLATASTYNLVLIGVERYLAVVHPIYHRRIVNKRSICLSLTLFIWSAVPLIELAMLLPTTDITTSGHCRDWNMFPNQSVRLLFGVLTFLFEYLTPSALMTVCYSRIYSTLKRRDRKRRSRASPATAGGVAKSAAADTPLAAASIDGTPPISKAEKRRRNVIATLITVVAVFFLCNSAKPLLYLVYNCGLTFDMSGSVYQMASVANFTNSAVNPLIYTFQYAAFQSELKKLWRTARGVPFDISA